VCFLWLDFYDAKSLADIGMQNASFLGLPILPQAAMELGKRARGTPRIVKRILRRVRDFAQVHKYKVIDDEVVQLALKFLGIDEDGLNKLDRKLLAHIIKDFDGGPVGIETLAAMTGEDKETLEDVCEPFLIRQGLIQKTTRGRQINPKKIIYLKRKLFGQNLAEQSNLFS